MLRLAEIGFFLVPFALFAAWRILGPRMPASVVWTTIALMLAMAAGTVWFGITNAIPPDEIYEPARIIDGELVPGHSVPKRQR